MDLPMCPEKFRQVDAGTAQVLLGHTPTPALPNRGEWGSAPLSFAAFRNDRGTLVIRLSGVYPDGSSGSGYFDQMVRTCREQCGKVSARALVVDLSDLTYRWGDEMGNIYCIDRKVPQATVVSDKNRRALSTLDFGMETERDITDLDDVFDSIDAAILYVEELSSV
jgi:hypothetical protein